MNITTFIEMKMFYKKMMSNDILTNWRPQIKWANSQKYTNYKNEPKKMWKICIDLKQARELNQ